MALRNIVEKGDPVLLKHCRPVTQFNEKLHVLLDDMRETLTKADGVGLAAPQVGILRRVVLVLETNVPTRADEYMLELINPEIVSESGAQEGPEGCLSLPGKAGTVTRPNYVRVKAYDENMEEYELEGTELLARTICHELDHLEGHMYTELVVGDIHEVSYEDEDQAEQAKQAKKKERKKRWRRTRRTA